MRIIPVIDVLGGVVVRAVGGRRGEYRPVKSRLTRSTDPVEVARVLLDATGATELYVADLDAITRSGFSPNAAEKITDEFPDVSVWLDHGLKTPEDVERLPWRRKKRWFQRFQPPGRKIRAIVATESAPSPDIAESLLDHGGTNAILSVDLWDGRWIGDWEPWRNHGIHEN
ncbi:MAG: HisA/HisF-related TIM barrel protein, partial [Fimbriiglobus sp.]